MAHSLRSATSRLGRRWPLASLRRGDDEGNTLVIALMVAFIASSLGMVVVQQTIVAQRDSGRDRQRTQQIHAAEAGIDAVYAQLQAGNLLCTWGPTDILASPEPVSVTANIAYYNASGAQITMGSGCTFPSGAVVTKAVITSSSSLTTTGGVQTKRTMESEVLLTPPSTGKGYALYSNASYTVPNQFSLKSDGTNPGDIYTRGEFNCTNLAVVEGSVYAGGGGGNLSNACTVSGSLATRNSVSMTNTSQVGLDVTSSRGSIAISDNTARVGRNVSVAGTFSGYASSVGGAILQGQTTIPDPPDIPLPYVGYEPSAWTAQGFTVVYANTYAECDAFKTKMFQVTAKTLFMCDGFSINWWGTNNNTLKTDVALMATGGINIANDYTITSSNSAQTRKLWFIVPAASGAKPATWNPPTSCVNNNGVTLPNTTTITASINFFVYACGSVSIANSTTLYGQIYGATTTTTNNFSMMFVPTAPPGVDLGGVPTTKNYGVSVVYKRETT